MTDKLRQRARELAEGIADKANECCYRSDGYEENIAALAQTAILAGMREALREEPDVAMVDAGISADGPVIADIWIAMAEQRSRGLE